MRERLQSEKRALAVEGDGSGFAGSTDWDISRRNCPLDLLLQTNDTVKRSVDQILYDMAARSMLQAQLMVGVISVRQVMERATDETRWNGLVYDKVEPDLLWIRMNGKRLDCRRWHWLLFVYGFAGSEGIFRRMAMLIKADRAGWVHRIYTMESESLPDADAGFTSAILLGTFLLMLPAASQTGASLSLIDALFTATSAVCVTGLTVVSTGDYFSVFGQMVIILLIQVGGLGVMTLTTLIAVLMGRKINLRKRMLVQESFNQLTLEGMVHLVLYVVKVTLLWSSSAGLF